MIFQILFKPTETTVNVRYTLRFCALLAAAFVLCFVVMGLSGCTTLRDNLDLTTPDQYAEGAFQVEHLVDVMQSMHGAAEDACFSEGDPATRAIVGAHPAQSSVFIWGIGYAAIHYGITAWLLDHDHDRIAAVWEAASIIDTAAVVDHNYSVGIRIGAPNRDDAACITYYHGHIPSSPTNLDKQ